MEKIKLNLQLFGGRGSSSGGGEGGGEGGPGLPKSKKGLSPASISKEVDVWSYRHNKNNEPFVDKMNQAARTMSDDFPGLMQDVTEVNAGTLKGAAARSVLGYYGGGRVALNTNYTNVDKMNKTYDAAVKSGYHPSRGSKTGTEAVMYHEMGHALTDHVAKKVGAKDLDASSQKIVDAAYKASKGKGGTKAWAGTISGYAKESYAECVAEAVADWYCNGKKASKASKAIMTELKKYK